MARIFFRDKDSLNKYFKIIKEKVDLKWSEIAKSLNISDRQLRDWRNGKNSIPKKVVDLIYERYKIETPSDIKIKKDSWHMKDASSKGGKRRFELYGHIGTLVSRRKGGLNSIKIHKIKNTNFKLAKKISIPKKNVILSEIVGAFIGDGCLSKRQAVIFLSLKKDRQYANHISGLIKDLFKIEAPVAEKPKRSTVEITINSVNFVKYLHKIGLPIGDKNDQGLDIPDWIKKNKKFQLACLRGIFDTDGCTYIDKHIYNKKIYRNIGVAYTTYSPNLIRSIVEILTKLGYSTSIKSNNRIFIRKERDVVRFFSEIVPAGERHDIVYKEFMERYSS